MTTEDVPSVYFYWLNRKHKRGFIINDFPRIGVLHFAQINRVIPEISPLSSGDNILSFNEVQKDIGQLVDIQV